MHRGGSEHPLSPSALGWGPRVSVAGASHQLFRGWQPQKEMFFIWKKWLQRSNCRKWLHVRARPLVQRSQHPPAFPGGESQTCPPLLLCLRATPQPTLSKRRPQPWGSTSCIS